MLRDMISISREPNLLLFLNVVVQKQTSRRAAQHLRKKFVDNYYEIFVFVEMLGKHSLICSDIW